MNCVHLNSVTIHMRLNVLAALSFGRAIEGARNAKEISTTSRRSRSARFSPATDAIGRVTCGENDHLRQLAE
jgi:hypothetical protein